VLHVPQVVTRDDICIFDHITTHMVGLSAMQVHGRANTPNADAMTAAAHITAKDDRAVVLDRSSGDVNRGNLELV
jgi:hypothetical protein